VDGRPIFVIPWNEQVLVGTTEVSDSGDPSKVHPTSDEIEYLLRSLLQLFSRAKLSSRDIRYSFSGIRPLPFTPKAKPSAVTRKHYLHDHSDDGAAQMISVIGGKLTTAAQLARECADKIGARSGKPRELAVLSGDNLDPVLDQWVVEIADAGGISEDSARGIVEWHGKRSLTIARMAISSAELRAPLCQHSEHIVAEAVDALANECAVTMADVLLRRVPVALGACWSEMCSRDAAARIGAVMGWNEQQAAAELEAFEIERAAFLCKPSARNGVLEAAAD
jgi:glycerol-3-phosphate dehydrogenase